MTMFLGRWTHSAASLLVARPTNSALNQLRVDGAPKISQSRLKSDTNDQRENPLVTKLKDRLTKDISNREHINISHQNGFKLFNIDQKFAINKMKLQTEMRRLQQLLHPDRFVSENRETQQLSDSLSALVNDFYSILGNPYERGKYLLALVTGQSQEEVLRSLEKLQLDGKFLVEMMETQEKIHDPAADYLELEKMRTILENDIESLTAEINRDFDSKNYERILKNLGKMKFLANNYNAIEDRLLK